MNYLVIIGSFREYHGRLCLHALAMRQGHDMQVMLSGGDAHIGAMAIASPGGESHTCDITSHRDGLPAASMARKLAKALGHTVAVTAGIHYNNITGDEIAQVLKLSDILAQRIIFHETGKKGKKQMLTMKDLKEFENYIRSGQLEENFKCGSEENRYQILELLEKLMDVSELADEAATRLIFRGLPGIGPHNPDDDPGSKTLQ